MKNVMKMSKVKSVTIRMGHWHLVIPLLLTLMFGLGQAASVKAENLDAIFANNGVNRVCLGNGAGGFVCSNVSTDTNDSEGVAVGFVNGDSFLDAVFANALGQPNNRVCLGNGAGGFSCDDVSTDMNQSLSVALGFVNGDSFLDAVFANQAGPNRVCLGNGAGGFSCDDVSSDMNQSVSVALGLVNADSNLDAVFANLEGGNTVCFGNGTGGFTSCTDGDSTSGVKFSPSGSIVRDVALGLVSADSNLDAVFAIETSGLVSNRVCFGDGTGAFPTCSIVNQTLPCPFPFDCQFSQGVALGLVNADSLLDVVYANGNGPFVVCLGNGLLLPIINLDCQTVSTVGSASDVALGLVNADSFLDAVFANKNGLNRVCLGNGDGTFGMLGSECSVISAPAPNTSLSVALGDFDPPPSGCCVIGINNCEEPRDMAQCDALMGTLDLINTCSEIPECNVPPPGMGCCVIGDNSCMDDLTMVQCDGEGGMLQEEVACSAIPQCNIPPPGEGCCVLGENDCINTITMTQCDESGGINFVLETDCDFVPTCNVPLPGEGCCVLGDNNCFNDQTEADCTAVGGIDFEVDTACSAVPQCDIPPPGEGCCVLGVNDCINDQTADECNETGGAIEIGVSCSAVPTCNNVMPPPPSLNVPTISQWGLIAMSGILGIVGFIMVIRRKKVTA